MKKNKNKSEIRNSKSITNEQIDTSDLKIKAAIKEASKEWMKYKGVEGVAAGNHRGEVSILVYVSQPVGKFEDKIPKHFQNFQVIVREKGKIKFNR